MGPDDLVPFKLGEGHERNDASAVDVGTRDRHLAVLALVLNHLENALRAGRPDRNDHDTACLQLLEERRRHVVDAAGDDDLVEWRRLLPSVIAIGRLTLDDLELSVTVLDELIINPTRALGERLDDLNRVYLIRQMREIGRLVARTCPDLEHS